MIKIPFGLECYACSSLVEAKTMVDHELKNYSLGMMSAVNNYEHDGIIDQYFKYNFKSSFKHKSLRYLKRYHNVILDIELIKIA